MTSNKKHLEEKTVSSKQIYQGKSFSFYSDEIELPDGRTALRDYVQYPEAVVIVPFMDKEHIILIEQYRYAVKDTLLELPAGKIDDPQEPKENAAFRELEEETGYRAGKMDYLFSFYPAVGYSSEQIHAFRASGLNQVGASPDEDEFIRYRIVALEEALQMIRGSVIKDSKTILTLLYISFLEK